MKKPKAIVDGSIDPSFIELKEMFKQSLQLLSECRQSLILEKSMAIDDEAEFNRLDKLVRQIDVMALAEAKKAEAPIQQQLPTEPTQAPSQPSFQADALANRFVAIHSTLVGASSILGIYMAEIGKDDSRPVEEVLRLIEVDTEIRKAMQLAQGNFENIPADKFPFQNL